MQCVGMGHHQVPPKYGVLSVEGGVEVGLSLGRGWKLFKETLLMGSQGSLASPGGKFSSKMIFSGQLKFDNTKVSHKFGAFLFISEKKFRKK